MVAGMAHDKVTLTLPGQTLTAAREVANETGTPLSAFVARAVRNEVLRRQLAALSDAGQLDLDADWLDTVEADHR